MEDELEPFLGFIQPSRFATRLSAGFKVLHLALADTEGLLEAARAVGPTGVVIGVDESLAVLDEVWEQAMRAGLKNIYLIQYIPKDFELDQPVDVVLN